MHARLTAALAHWRGAAFQEFGGLAWADLEASRLDELRLLATEQLAARGAAAGPGRRRSSSDLDRLTAEQPLREEAWRLLALALYQSGRQGDALAALRRARARLAAELGVDPGPALRDAGRRTSSPRPRTCPPRLPAASGAGCAYPGAADGDPAPAPRRRLFGRDAELRQVAAGGAGGGRAGRRSCW